MEMSTTRVEEATGLSKCRNQTTFWIRLELLICWNRLCTATPRARTRWWKLRSTSQTRIPAKSLTTWTTLCTLLQLPANSSQNSKLGKESMACKGRIWRKRWRKPMFVITIRKQATWVQISSLPWQKIVTETEQKTSVWLLSSTKVSYQNLQATNPTTWMATLWMFGVTSIVSTASPWWTRTNWVVRTSMNLSKFPKKWK